MSMSVFVFPLIFCLWCLIFSPVTRYVIVDRSQKLPDIHCWILIISFSQMAQSGKPISLDLKRIKKHHENHESFHDACGRSGMQDKSPKVVFYSRKESSKVLVSVCSLLNLMRSCALVYGCCWLLTELLFYLKRILSEFLKNMLDLIENT